MQCHEFVGKWKVSAGSVPNHIQGNTYHVTISPQEQGQNACLLRYLENGRARDFQQKLIYNRWTGTLDKDPQDPGQDRCISFWNGSPAGDETNRIFAMRRKHEKIAKKYLCPWELSEDWKDLADESLLEGTDGSWGAEEEPP